VCADFVITKRIFSASSDWSFVDQLKGINVLLSAHEHCLGLTVDDRFQISGLLVSGKHCKIYSDTVLGELNRSEHVSIYLKDTRVSFLLLDPCLPDIFFLFILFSN
jgi:hypothetical protein